MGALGVLLLYFVVLMRLTQNAQTAPDRAGTFLVMGVVAVLDLSYPGQHWHGARFYAGHRNTFTLNELRRIVGPVHVFSTGDGDERPYAPLRELKQPVSADASRENLNGLRTEYRLKDYDRSREKRATHRREWSAGQN